MSHLYCQCQKHKHFCFSNIRFRRGSIVKSVYVIMAVAVSLHHQQNDNFCKIQKKNAKWTGAVIFVWCFIVLLSSVARCICVCCIALRARGGCTLQGYWLLSLFTWPTLTCIFFLRGTGWNWTAGLMTTGCLAVWLRLWHPWHTFGISLNWTDIALNWTYIAWYSRFITIQCQQSVQIFCWAAGTVSSFLADSLCHHSHQLSTAYWEE